jgi:hypothetical protein
VGGGAVVPTLVWPPVAATPPDAGAPPLGFETVLPPNPAPPVGFAPPTELSPPTEFGGEFRVSLPLQPNITLTLEEAMMKAQKFDLPKILRLRRTVTFD